MYKKTNEKYMGQKCDKALRKQQNVMGLTKRKVTIFYTFIVLCKGDNFYITIFYIFLSNDTKILTTIK